jgi:H+-transporting ATPase
VPGDARLICDYDRPEDFEFYQQRSTEESFGDNNNQGDEEHGDESNTEQVLSNSSHSAGQADHRFHTIVAVDQSAITGESLAVDKYMGEVVYYTTGCKRGKAYAVVVTSAKFSFVGRTADLVQGAKDQGHFKAVMDSIGTSLLVLVMFWILVAWIGGFYHHIRIATPGSQNLLHYALVLLIIGVPVGLPVVTTTTLAVGAAYLARQKAIVQKLTAIESLAVIMPQPVQICLMSI